MSLSSDQHEIIEQQISRLVASTYQELSNNKLEIRALESESDFFSTSVDRAYRSSTNRLYVIYVNPRLFDSPPMGAALQAILAHELEHLLDYTRMMPWELLWLRIRYDWVNDANFIAEYERQTDRKVIQRGFGPGLKEYRLWLYSRLRPEQIQQKKSRYLTPEEIDEISSNK